MQTTDTAKLERNEKVKAIISLLGIVAFFVKSTWGINIPQEYLNDLVDAGLLLWSAWGWLRNNYVTKRGIKQLHVLKNSKLQ